MVEEKFTRFGHIQEYIISEAVKTIEAGKNKFWAEFFGRLVFNLVTVVLALSLVINSINIITPTVSKIIHLVKPKEQPLYALKTLTYTRLIKNEEQKNGLYRNLFKLTITHPAGNIDPYTFTTLNIGQDGECEYGSEIAIAEIGAGLATTTRDYLMDCTTKEPLIDNGNLFGIVNDNEKLKKDFPQTHQ